jgi:two-component system response regulator NreC
MTQNNSSKNGSHNNEKPYTEIESSKSKSKNNFLTPRQQQVLKFLALGLINREIAKELSVSVQTIDAHRVDIMQRLGIHDLAGLIKYALRNNLISLD